MLYYAFDPRRLCKDSRTLSAGAQVVVSYGFEKQTKKLWQGGKMVEIDAKQTDPFVARVAAGDAQEDPQMAGLKHVVADPFVLGATYPLEDVALEETAAKDVAPPPLRLSVSDLGTLSSPESSAIRVTVTNTSGRTLPLLLRREIIRYEVIGQWSSATCIMDPTDRAPDPAGFTTLSPGESQTLITRLAEACPPETFRYPGRYAISARLTATATGSEHGIDASPLAEAADALRRDGATAIHIGVAGTAAGIFAIADPIKETTPLALNALHAEGIRIVMLTGDNRTTAEAIARQLGIDEVEADVLPERKSEAVARLRAEGRVVAMAGDGVNDAPALAAADVGIAMGSGTDVAIESAGVTLLKGDLTGIVRARRLSEATMRNIRQNLAFAFIYNAAGVPVAAGLLYPFFGLLLSPIIAAAAMALSSVSVIANSLRLRGAGI